MKQKKRKQRAIKEERAKKKKKKSRDKQRDTTSSSSSSSSITDHHHKSISLSLSYLLLPSQGQLSDPISSLCLDLFVLFFFFFDKNECDYYFFDLICVFLIWVFGYFLMGVFCFCWSLIFLNKKEQILKIFRFWVFIFISLSIWIFCNGFCLYMIYLFVLWVCEVDLYVVWNVGVFWIGCIFYFHFLGFVSIHFLGFSYDF